MGGGGEEEVGFYADIFFAFSFLLDETFYIVAIVSNCSVNCPTLLVLEKRSEEIENQCLGRQNLDASLVQNFSHYQRVKRAKTGFLSCGHGRIFACEIRETRAS